MRTAIRIVNDHDVPTQPEAVFDSAGLASDPLLVDVLVCGLGGSQAGVCLCDADDNVRFANETFRKTFFPSLMAGATVNFVDAVIRDIVTERGIRLVSSTPDEFVPRIKHRRLSAAASCNFAVDMHDGRWWWISDHKLACGWMLTIANEMSALKAEEMRLRDAHALAMHAAQTDFLTGIANRRWGFERAQATLLAAAQAGPTAIALIDIDHFKTINDGRGHEAGDKVLVHFAAWIARTLRGQDQASRIGGEEFLVVLPETGAREADRLIGRLLADLPPAETGSGTALDVTASAGIAVAAPGETLDQVLIRADHALYAAKLAGRNRIVHSAA